MLTDHQNQFGRPPEPREIADLIVYLLSDDRRSSPAQELVIDGGLTAQ